MVKPAYRLTRCCNNKFMELPYNLRMEVLIVGGGLAGIFCVYFLHESGVDYILLDNLANGNAQWKIKAKLCGVPLLLGAIQSCIFPIVLGN